MSRERTCTSLCDVENFYNSQVRLLQSNTETAIVWDISTSTNHELEAQLQFYGCRDKLQSSTEEHFISKCGNRMQVWDGCSSGTARSDPRSGIPRSNSWISTVYPDFNPLSLPVTFLHLQTPNSDSHSHSHSHSHTLSSNTDDVSPTYDHLKQFCPKIILMTLTIRSSAILPSCSDGGSLFLEWTMTRVVFIAQNSINGKILPNPRRFPLWPKLNILSKHFFIFYFSPFTAFSCVFYCADVRNMA